MYHISRKSGTFKRQYLIFGQEWTKGAADHGVSGNQMVFGRERKKVAS